MESLANAISLRNYVLLFLYALYSQYLNKADMRDVLVCYDILYHDQLVYVVFQLTEMNKMEVLYH